MNFDYEKLEDFCDAHSDEFSEYLFELYRFYTRCRDGYLKDVLEIEIQSKMREVDEILEEEKLESEEELELSNNEEELKNEFMDRLLRKIPSLLYDESLKNKIIETIEMIYEVVKKEST